MKDGNPHPRTIENGAPEQVVEGITGFGSDIATLAELQAQLALTDLEESLQKVLLPLVLLAVGMTQLGGTVLLGVAAGMGLMMFVVAFGLGSLILNNPIILIGVKWCGAAFLCWLAWKIATAHGPSASSGARPIGFLGAAAFQWINPKSWLVCASAAATFLDRGSGSALGQSIAMSAIFIVVSAPVKNYAFADHLVRSGGRHIPFVSVEAPRR